MHQNRVLTHIKIIQKKQKCLKLSTMSFSITHLHKKNRTQEIYNTVTF